MPFKMLIFFLTYIIEIGNKEKLRACEDSFYIGKMFCLVMNSHD